MPHYKSRLFKEQLIFIKNNDKDKILFVDLDFEELIIEITDSINTVKKIVFLCTKEELPSNNKIKQEIIAYEDLVNQSEELNEWPEFDERTASSLCYTSGTTGNPKGVLYSHRSTMIHTLAAANPDALNISSTDVIMPIAPMFHAMLGVFLILPIW